MKISLFNSTTDIKPAISIDLHDFINKVKDGEWRELAERVQAVKNKKERQELKKRILPAVTISGVFDERKDAAMREHSGVLAIDIDDMDNVDDSFNELKEDPHCLALFKSVSGQGLCFLMKIDGKQHAQIFEGAQQYFFEEYATTIDSSCRNLSRLRYVSYDPQCYINLKAKKFVKKVSKKQKTPPTLKTVVHVKSNFHKVLQQITERGLDICDDDYHKWLNVGFALASEFGEEGREYFHLISSEGTKYDSRKADKQYTHCLSSRGSGVSIGTFYYYAQQKGIEVNTDDIKRMVKRVAQLAKKGKSRDESKKTIRKEFAQASVTEVVDQVYDLKIDVPKEKERNKILRDLLDYVNREYDLRRNVITKKVEVNGDELTDAKFNSMYLDTIMYCNPDISQDLFKSVVYSEHIKQYDPIEEFVKEHEHVLVEGDPIKDLVEAIPAGSDKQREFNLRFFRKWYMSIIANIHGKASPLVLVLVGIKQGTGKTEFFRRLLPDQLAEYYNESKLDAGKDDEMLMTQSIIVMDDEFGGKSKVEEKRFKELTSKAWFSLRLPYGRHVERHRRISTLAGTSNDFQVINDVTGNRRLIPIPIDSDIDHKKYNSVDKVALFMYAWRKYHEEPDKCWALDIDEMNQLNDQDEYSQVDNEEELILKFFSPEPPKDYVPVEVKLTGSEIQDYMLQHTNIKTISKKKIGLMMRKHGFASIRDRVGSGSRLTFYRCYKNLSMEEEIESNKNKAKNYAKKHSGHDQNDNMSSIKSDDLPF